MKRIRVFHRMVVNNKLRPSLALYHARTMSADAVNTYLNPGDAFANFITEWRNKINAAN